MSEEFVVYCYTSDAPRIILFDVCPSDNPESALATVQLEPAAPTITTLFDCSYLEPSPPPETEGMLTQRLKSLKVVAKISNHMLLRLSQFHAMTLKEIADIVKSDTGLTVEVV